MALLQPHKDRPRVATATGVAREPIPFPVAPAVSITDLAPANLLTWVEQQRQILQPDAVHWVDGSRAEAARLADVLVAAGTLIKLNPEWRPGSYLARSTEDDVARVESRTFVCTPKQEDLGPIGNWRDPQELRAELAERFAGAMRGRTMYVVVYSMGPIGGSFSRIGVQLTDSGYAVLNMRMMTRVGRDVLETMTEQTHFVKGVHSVGYPLRDERGVTRPDVTWPANEYKAIAHFPQDDEILSYGSGYGGNALLGKKCFSLRIGSAMGLREGWLAEHMLLMRLTSPEGKRYHIAAAFPSACGKTNFAMLQPTLPGWKVETFGDDIVWMRVGEDGRLWAINPEAGFFGVAPGTSSESNPVAMDMLWGNTIFTNVALRPDGDVWWEGMTERPPAGLIDWRGQPWTPGSGRPAAHPNSRFTVPAAQCPSISDDWDDPNGVPLDAIIFGGRRADTVPLVAQSFGWRHGVFMGATMGSEQTAAAEGTVGVLRRDPFAMRPFLAINMADHWQHWMNIGEQLGEKAPAIFQVNWFRKNEHGKFLWPGFGENSRVLEWIAGRVDGNAEAELTPVGYVPESLNLEGLDNFDETNLERLLAVDGKEWRAELASVEEHFAQFGDRLPAGMRDELRALRLRLLLPEQAGRH